MASELVVKLLLAEAAEKLTDRKPTEQEECVLYKYYLEAGGSMYRKTVEALRKYASFSEMGTLCKKKATDDMDKFMHEVLEQLIIK